MLAVQLFLIIGLCQSETLAQGLTWLGFSLAVPALGFVAWGWLR